MDSFPARAYCADGTGMSKPYVLSVLELLRDCRVVPLAILLPRRDTPRTGRLPWGWGPSRAEVRHDTTTVTVTGHVERA
jgi:hypothetical protein